MSKQASKRWRAEDRRRNKREHELRHRQAQRRARRGLEPIRRKTTADKEEAVANVQAR